MQNLRISTSNSQGNDFVDEYVKLHSRLKGHSAVKNPFHIKSKAYLPSHRTRAAAAQGAAWATFVLGLCVEELDTTQRDGGVGGHEAGR